MTFTVSSATDVQDVASKFHRMTDQHITDPHIALQIRTGSFSWKSITFDEALAWPFNDEPTELVVYDLSHGE